MFEQGGEEGRDRLVEVSCSCIIVRNNSLVLFVSKKEGEVEWNIYKYVCCYYDYYIYIREYYRWFDLYLGLVCLGSLWLRVRVRIGYSI